MVRLSLWFVDLEFEARSSLRILVNSSARRILLDVEMRTGKNV